MLEVVGMLQGTASLGLFNRHLHGVGNGIAVEDDLAVEVARRPAYGLDQRTGGAQEALFIRIENRHQRHLRHVETFPQQVDPHQHIKLAEAQITDDLHPLHGIDVGVEVAHLDPVLRQIFGQILSHSLGQGSDQHPLLHGNPFADLGEQIVHLGADRPHFHLGIEQAGGTHHLLHYIATRLLQLVGAGGRRNKHRLRHQCLKFVELERPVVERRGKPETVLHQSLLAGAVPFEHGTDLRHRDVGFIDDEQAIPRQVVKQGGRRLPRRAAGEVATVVLDAGAVAQLLHHLHVELGTLVDALLLHQLVE